MKPLCSENNPYTQNEINRIASGNRFLVRDESTCIGMRRLFLVLTSVPFT